MYSFYYSYNIIGVPKSAAGYIMGKVHLIPLQSVPQLLAVLNVQGRAVLCDSLLVGTMFIPHI
jgi:hypothetical protein